MKTWQPWTVDEIRKLPWYPHRAPSEGRDAFEAAMLADPGPHASAYAKAEWRRAHPCWDGVMFSWPPKQFEIQPKPPSARSVNPAPHASELRASTPTPPVASPPPEVPAVKAPIMQHREEPVAQLRFRDDIYAIESAGWHPDVGLDIWFLRNDGMSCTAFWQPTEISRSLARMNGAGTASSASPVQPHEIAGLMCVHCVRDTLQIFFHLKNDDLAMYAEPLEEVRRWGKEHPSFRDRIMSHLTRAVLMSEQA